MGDGVLHVVGDHEGGEVVLLHDLVGQSQHLVSGLGVQSGSVLIQQQQLGLLQGGHQQRQRLTLTAGEQAHLGGEAVLKPQIQRFQQFPVICPLQGGDAPLQPPGLAPAGCQRQIFLDLHGGRGAHHGVLKHPPQKCRPLVLRQLGNVLPVNGDGAGIHLEHASDGVQHGGLARTVAADHGDKIPVIQRQVQMVQSYLSVDGIGIKRLADILQLKHGRNLPSWCGCGPSSRGSPGTQPRSGRTPASDRWCSDPTAKRFAERCSR